MTEDSNKLYAKVVLPLAVHQTYSYKVPIELKSDVAIGKRVQVQFGAKRMYAGMVVEIFEQEAPDYKVKDILHVIDENPILTDHNLKLWEWMAHYYMCNLGEIMIAALPTALKLSSETKVVLNPNFTHDYSTLDDNEYLVAEALAEHKELALQDVQGILQKKNVYYLIKSLLDKGVLILEEEMQESYKPKMVPYISLVDMYYTPEKQKELFEHLEKAPKQLDVLLAYLSIIKNKKSVSQKSVLQKAAVTSAPLNALIKKGIFTKEKQAVDRIIENYKEEQISFSLSENQRQAFDQIKKIHQEKNVVLLHGITSSGKTQVYIEYINEIIKENKTVLYLLPEIALSGQMIQRLRKVFGNDVGIYHSKFNPQERVEIWQKVVANKYKVIVGVRSSLFLPINDLGLVIVDEEHDSSYKQQNPAPRYNARDTAIKLASLHGAKVILGSASPSFESYFNALQNKFGLVTLSERFGGVKPPEIQFIDTKDEGKKKRMRSHFSQTLIEAIEASLKAEEQVILFKNRRGYAPIVTCGSCGYVPTCIRCDVKLTYHKYSNLLKCHYCGYSEKIQSQCKDCNSPDIQMKGFGTEKIEDELKIFFPGRHFARLDLETTRSKNGFMKILNAFEEKSIDILVGTQMVTKGLDFDNVGLVGIISADSLLHYPDFRASERAFQLMLQVSGRAGRREKRGKVLIQATSTNHDVYRKLYDEDYIGFFKGEISERRNWKFPPFNRLIKLTLKHRDSKVINTSAFTFAEQLNKRLPGWVIGPSTPPVSMIRNMFIRNIVLKLPNTAKGIANGKHQLLTLIKIFKGIDAYKALVIQMDVDPY